MEKEQKEKVRAEVYTTYDVGEDGSTFENNIYCFQTGAPVVKHIYEEQEKEKEKKCKVE